MFRQILRPGHVAVDVGAHIGAHTMPIAKAVRPGGAVLALEPQRIMFQTLCANVALNGLEKVDAQCAALGRKPGAIHAASIDYAFEGNFAGGALGTGKPGERVAVKILDSIGLIPCQFIKIDVEGMEGTVIAGAAQTIRRLRPLLYVENDRPDKSAALIQQLIDLGYRLHWLLPKLLNPGNFL